MCTTRAWSFLQALSFAQFHTEPCLQLKRCGILSLRSDGIGITCIMFLCVPALINDWFDQRVGTFMGPCFAFTGIGGTGSFNPIGFAYYFKSNLKVGACYLICAGYACRNTPLLTLFVVREKPKTLALPPPTFSLLTRKYIELQRLPSTDISADDVQRTSRVSIWLLVFYVLITFNQQISQYLSYAATFAGTAPAIAAARPLLNNYAGSSY